jgi:hypothetical protein
MKHIYRQHAQQRNDALRYQLPNELGRARSGVSGNVSVSQ